MIPWVSSAVDIASAAVDGAQLGVAIWNRDWPDVRDEVGDLAGDFAGAVAGLIPIPGASTLIGQGVGSAVTAGLDKLAGIF